MKRLFILSIFVLLTLSFSNCKPEAVYRETAGMLHTPYHIKYKHHQDLTEEIDKELKRFYYLFNAFDSTSVISAINTNKNFTISDSVLIEAINCAKKLSDITEGAYDITCAPLINLWGFGFSKKESVTTEHIDSIKQFVGSEKIEIKEGKLIKQDPRILLNCSSLADGTVCDMIADIFESRHIKDYMIEFGGEIAARGLNPKGEAWKIGINRPEDDHAAVNRNAIDCIVQYQKKADEPHKRYCMATSGNYRNFYIKEGKKYAHTIDPRSGQPVQKDVLSATIIAPKGMLADACATACMVLGSEGAAALKKQLPEIEYYLICSPDSTERYRIVTSKGFSNYVYKDKLSILEEN